MRDPEDQRDAPPEPITIGMVAHYVFCPRRAWLEAVGERTDSFQVAAGLSAHARTDVPGRSQAMRTRAVDVVNEPWGYHGRCDTVVRSADGLIEVVEYKATPVRRRAEVTEAMRMQLALQAAALTSMGFTVAGQSVYFTEHQQRVPVVLDDEDFDRAHDLVVATRAVLDSPEAPPVLEDDRRCARCSHASVCLPDERPMKAVTRRIQVADPDAQVVHLTVPGSRGSIRAGRLEVVKGEERLATIPIERIQGLVIHGNIDLSGALIRQMLWRSLTVVWCSSSGRVIGWANPGDGPNGAARVRQHVAAANGRLDLSRQFIAAKVSNQATMLRRNGSAPGTVALLRQLAGRARQATSNPELFGIEGEAAAVYFAGFGTMLKSPELSMTVRTRRPAADPVNAALNFAYALLIGDVVRAVVACGLDAHAGFLHSSNRNKPALALDLCEEFRPLVADSAVVRAFNNGEVAAGGFSTIMGACTLRPDARKALIGAYEQRVQSTFRHPVFGYEVTWRRAMEIQARLILGVLDGTQQQYIGITTR